MPLGEARERAAAFVALHGDDLARARVDVLLGRAAPDAVLERLSWRPEPTALARRTLGICDDLRALNARQVEALVGALARSQDADGGWAEDRPLEERLFEAGMIAGHLAKTRCARPEVLGAAADFLAAHWSPDRVRGGSWPAIAAYAHLFANQDHDAADAILQWCGRELGRSFAERRFDALRTARILVYCDAHGLPGAQLAPGDLAAALIAEQEGDGGFRGIASGEREPVARVETTLDGLVALIRLSP